MNEYVYRIVITQANNNYSAYCPELPGVFTVGDTVPETLNYMLEAMQFHLEGIVEDGLPVPVPAPQLSVDEAELVGRGLANANVSAAKNRQRSRPT